MTIDLSVRAMTRADLAGARQVLRSSGLFPPEMLEAMAEPYLSGEAAPIWLVATCRDEVVGFAHSEPERMTNGTHNLLAIAVAAERQRSGIGAALVHGVESVLRNADARLLLVETSTDADQDEARAFYPKMGFGEEARIRDFYADNQTKVVFRKRLRRQR
jgi:ribosomal protein S18 acetylase RimI-like enzyme